MAVATFRIVLIVALLAPANLFAHASGASLESIVGEYHIDIGYDPPTVVGGDQMIFDFNLMQAAASTSVPFDYVWVRMRNQGYTLLATGIRRAEIGPTSLLYTLPRGAEGTLTLAVRFQRGEESLAESDFEITVAPYADPKWWQPYAFGALPGFFVGALGWALFMFWRSRRNVKNSE